MSHLCSAVMASQLTLRSLARSSGIWTRPISTSSARFTENKDKTMYEQVKDKAGGEHCWQPASTPSYFK